MRLHHLVAATLAASSLAVASPATGTPDTSSAAPTAAYVSLHRYATGSGQAVRLDLGLQDVSEGHAMSPGVPGTSTVRLQQRVSGSSTWRTVRTVTLHDGRGSTVVWPRSTRHYRISYWSTSRYSGSVSTSRGVSVGTGRWSTLSTSASEWWPGRPLTVTARLVRSSDSKPLRGRTVRLLRPSGDGTWRVASTKKTSSTGRVSWTPVQHMSDVPYVYRVLFHGDGTYTKSGWEDCASFCGE